MKVSNLTMSFMKVMKSKGPKIDPWPIPCVTLPQLENIFGLAVNGFISTFCFLFVRQDLNQCPAVP
jgi:hypothetical protein